MAVEESKEDAPQSSHSSEWLTFLFVTMVFFPGLAIAIVGGYGFIVWMLQLINGPPVVG